MPFGGNSRDGFSAPGERRTEVSGLWSDWLAPLSRAAGLWFMSSVGLLLAFIITQRFVLYAVSDWRIVVWILCGGLSALVLYVRWLRWRQEDEEISDAGMWASLALGSAYAFVYVTPSILIIILACIVVLLVLSAIGDALQWYLLSVLAALAALLVLSLVVVPVLADILAFDGWTVLLGCFALGFPIAYYGYSIETVREMVDPQSDVQQVVIERENRQHEIDLIDEYGIIPKAYAIPKDDPRDRVLSRPIQYAGFGARKGDTSIVPAIAEPQQAARGIQGISASKARDRQDEDGRQNVDVEKFEIYLDALIADGARWSKGAWVGDDRGVSKYEREACRDWLERMNFWNLGAKELTHSRDYILGKIGRES